ncbi:MAG: NACHT domain-containing protein, partial [Candidatus Methanoperedens sp.]|nr:NACHT domain-containing protein [Candidatus Methanoperedens sp.]
MLQKVRDFWVKGVLEKSLYAEARLELGLDYRPGAADNPWDSVLQHTQYGDYKLPPGAKAADVFHDLNGELLILGEPGSGKTTTLLELARDLIDRAEKDETLPIPVVFNLSSWAAERKPLADWLADELNTKYQVPKKAAQEWVKADALTLLLDGLDEVAAQHRNTCVDAINIYRAEHGFVDLVVCSRTKEYDELTTKLKLQGAIVLKPLTMEQVDSYFAAFGGELDAVRNLLEDDEPLQEMVQSPLMLSIMAMAYRGVPADQLQTPNNVDTRRKHLFDTYIRRMFERKGKVSRYMVAETTRWLNHLAIYMYSYNRTEFLIESLQPNWLLRYEVNLSKLQNTYRIPDVILQNLTVEQIIQLRILQKDTTRERYLSYFRLGSANIAGLLCGLSMGISIGIAFDVTVGIFTGIITGVAYGLSTGQVISSLTDEPSLAPKIQVELISWSLNKKTILTAFVFGIVGFLAAGLV